MSEENKVDVLDNGEEHMSKKIMENKNKSPSKVVIVENLAKKTMSKNRRKSRKVTGRGNPKKGGAGGKGVWGQIGNEEDEIAVDKKDPNYDSESNIIVSEVIPVLNKDDMEKEVLPILKEYLETGDSGEVSDLLDEMNLGENRHEVLIMAVNLALDRHDPQRELTSRLISDLYSFVLSREEVMLGFEGVLQQLSELVLDTPDAPQIIANFIARAIADDCLQPNFVKMYQGDCQYTSRSLLLADKMLSIKQGLVKLDSVWGEGGGNRPVKSLIRQMRTFIIEYHNSDDIKEAMRCLADLDVPHFHHEVVYEGILMAIEASETVRSSMIKTVGKLFTEMCNANAIKPDQFEKGMRRIFEEIEDLSLDVPNAFHLLEDVCKILFENKVMEATLYSEVPSSRGRKRFISEGEGAEYVKA